MMRTLLARGDAAAARLLRAHVDALGDRATAELPGDLHVEKIADGIAVSGTRLVHRLAFDGRLRGVTLGLREDRQ